MEEVVITTIYMVRHGESPKTEGNERTRGLTEKGKEDARIVADILQEEGIDTFVSSPYSRAVLTLEGLAKSQGKEIHVFEDLREMVFVPGDRIVSNDELYPVVRRMFADAAYSLSGGKRLRFVRSGLCVYYNKSYIPIEAKRLRLARTELS